MKKLTTLIFSLLAFAAGAAVVNPNNAGHVSLAWDKSPDDYRTNDVFYRIYAGTNAALATNTLASLTNAYAGTNLSLTLTNLAAGKWFFVGTAFQGGVESLPSNLVTYTIRTTPPTAPQNLGTIFFDTTIDLTNWTERGFFRVRLNLPSP